MTREVHVVGAARIPCGSGPAHSLSTVEKSLLAHLVCLVRPHTVIELGVYEGVTSAFLCEVLEENGIDGRVFAFDLPDVVDRVRELGGEASRWEAAGRLRLVGGSLPGSLDRWLADNADAVDLALVDARHDYPSVKGELARVWERLSPEGYIVLDDYLERTDGVRWAVDAFVRAHEDAMCVPLLSSRAAEGAGVQSKLAVLRRRPYVFGRGAALRRHDWPIFKAWLLDVPGVERLWRIVRPLFRSGDA